MSDGTALDNTRMWRIINNAIPNSSMLPASFTLIRFFIKL
jgi:hypothetical protein